MHLSSLHAKNNVVVKEYISHSYVKSGNQLLVGQDTGKGIVFGGHCEALHRVAINQLGNEAHIPTHVTAGKLSELTKEYHDLENELAARSQEVTQLETILQGLQKADPVVLGKVPIDKSKKIVNTIAAIHEKVVSTQTLLQALDPEFELQKRPRLKSLVLFIRTPS